MRFKRFLLSLIFSKKNRKSIAIQLYLGAKQAQSAGKLERERILIKLAKLFV